MKRFTYLMIVGVFLVLMNSCAGYKLQRTAWYNVSPMTVRGEEGNTVTTLYFIDKKHVVFNGGAIKDGKVIVPAKLIATGSYTHKGNLKKGVSVNINAINVYQDTLTYQGVILPEGMVLASPTKAPMAFTKAANIKVQ